MQANGSVSRINLGSQPLPLEEIPLKRQGRLFHKVPNSPVNVELSKALNNLRLDLLPGMPASGPSPASTPKRQTPQNVVPVSSKPSAQKPSSSPNGHA